MLGLDPDEKLKLDDQDSISFNSILRSTETIIIEKPIKFIVDSISENDRKRTDFLSVCKDVDTEIDILKRIILDSITVERDPTLIIKHRVKKILMMN